MRSSACDHRSTEVPVRSTRASCRSRPPPPRSGPPSDQPHEDLGDLKRLLDGGLVVAGRLSYGQLGVRLNHVDVPLHRPGQRTRVRVGRVERDHPQLGVTISPFASQKIFACSKSNFASAAASTRSTASRPAMC